MEVTGIDVAGDASATPALYPAQSQGSSVPCGIGRFEGFGEGALNVEAHSRHRTQRQTASGQDYKMLRRLSQLTHESWVPCVVQLCGSRIWFDRSYRLRCC